MVHLKCKGKYGYEYIMKGVSKHFATKIHVNPWRLRMFEKLIDMLQHFTTDRESTQIHCCYNPTKESETCLPCGLASADGKNIKLLTIVPSSLWFVRNGILPKYRCFDRHQRIWRVVHSMHASYSEIREVVSYIKP